MRLYAGTSQNFITGSVGDNLAWKQGGLEVPEFNAGD